MPLRESDNYGYCDTWKSYNIRESNQEKKQRADTKYEAKKSRAITLQGAIEKSPFWYHNIGKIKD